MSLEQQIQTSKDTIQNLLANLAFFQSRNDTGLVRETAQDIREQQFLISKLQTDINRRDSPLGQLEIINNKINNLESQISMLLNQATRAEAAGRNDIQNQHPKIEVRNRRQRAGARLLQTAENLRNQASNLQNQVKALEEQKQQLENFLENFSFDSIGDQLQEQKPQEITQTNTLRNVLLVGGALALL